MISFIWKILSMPCYPQVQGEQDVVFQVNWQCQAFDDVYSASSFGNVPVTYSSGTPFTPYNQLTEEQVWGWVNPQINRTAIETNLQVLIDEQKNPQVVTPPLPWSN
jgi:hypothetical protein